MSYMHVPIYGIHGIQAHSHTYKHMYTNLLMCVRLYIWNANHIWDLRHCLLANSIVTGTFQLRDTHNTETRRETERDSSFTRMV